MDQILSEISDFQPEYVVNFAAQAWLDRGGRLRRLVQRNTLAMVDLHDRLRQLKFLKRFLLVYLGLWFLLRSRPRNGPFQPQPLMPCPNNL